MTKNKNTHKNVLIAPLGTSPQVITETLDKMLFEKKIEISEVVVIHTNHTIVLNGLKKLKKRFKNGKRKKTRLGHLTTGSQYCRLSKPKKVFSPITLTEVNLGIEDINSKEGNDKVQLLLYDEILRRKKKGMNVYVSISGGRKSMSAYALLAAQLLGACSVTHVIVPKNVEKDPECFHPPLDSYKLIPVPVFNFFGLLKTLTERTHRKLESGKDIIEILNQFPELVTALAEIGADRVYKESEIHKPKKPKKFGELLYISQEMENVVTIAKKVADSDVTILITGETGTGKELIAKAIHNESKRKDNPFIPVNCSAITETVLGSELFGHKRGAFTGASRDRKGHFEEANEGTIFLDEIGDAPRKIQVALLRALQEKEIVRLGESRPRKVNVRIIAATNKNLKKCIENGTFREDLYRRLSVIPIKVPPLRERKEDIVILANHFLKKYAKDKERKLSKEFVNSLKKYHWPGNVGELENIMRRIIELSDSKIIGIKDLPEEIQALKEPPKDSLEETIKEQVKYVLRKTKGNKTKAAELLGISTKTLYNYLKKYRISV